MHSRTVKRENRTLYKLTRVTRKEFTGRLIGYKPTFDKLKIILRNVQSYDKLFFFKKTSINYSLKWKGIQLKKNDIVNFKATVYRLEKCKGNNQQQCGSLVIHELKYPYNLVNLTRNH